MTFQNVMMVLALPATASKVLKYWSPDEPPRPQNDKNYEVSLPPIPHHAAAAETAQTFKNTTAAEMNNSPPPPPPRSVKKMTHLNDADNGGNVIKPAAGLNSNQFASLQRFSSQGLPGGHHHHHHHHYHAYHQVQHIPI